MDLPPRRRSPPTLDRDFAIVLDLLVGALIVTATAAATAAVNRDPRSSPHTADLPLQRLFHAEPTDPPTLKTRYTAAQIGLLEKLNRRDLEHLVRLKEIVVPDVWSDDELSYSPMPAEWTWAATFDKVIVVDQPAQVFGAYEQGRLVRWGPVSTGRKETPTPSGVYHLTWRAKSRVSTDNAQWLLKWYFNFINERGVSFHQFELPGTAASHACVRLLERDAQWVYGWGQEWTLAPDRRAVTATGTPVVVLGAYAFDRPAPWLSLEWWARAMVLPEDPMAPPAQK